MACSNSSKRLSSERGELTISESSRRAFAGCSTPEGIGAAARKSAIALLNERVEEGDSGVIFGEMVETGPQSTIRSQ
jgi:hypothetical protein